MAIIDTLTTIKDYFISWHDKYYDALHEDTIEDLTQEINARENADTNINNKIDNLTASQVRDTKRNQTVQTTLDNYVKTYADAGTRTLKTDYEIHPTGENGSPRGFYNVMSKQQDGLMSWQDKAVLKYTGEWLELTHDNWASIHKDFQIWVNTTLRLVYFHFQLKDCTWLKNDTTNFTTHGCSSELSWFHVRPIKTIWAPTNHVGVQFGVANDGVFYLRSDRKIAKATFSGSTFWFYRDSNMYDKLRT